MIVERLNDDDIIAVRLLLPGCGRPTTLMRHPDQRCWPAGTMAGHQQAGRRTERHTTTTSRRGVVDAIIVRRVGGGR